MDTKRMLALRIAFWGLITGVLAPGLMAEVLYIDARTGNDINPGSKDKPIQTIGRAADIVNSSTKAGPTTIKIGPGLYNLTRQVNLKNNRAYTQQNRLIIEAAVLPDDPDWMPKLMPVIISTGSATKSETEDYKYSADKYTIGLDIKISHVTIKGIKFLGNPTPHTWHYPIWRTGKDLEDLVVTQCMFVGDKHAIPYLSPICAMGHKIIADHCIFYNCHTPLIFWDAEGGLNKGCAARYCIIDGAFVAAIWTTQTAEDFEFHHNIITRSKYVWMRGRENHKQYTLRNCVITENTCFSGYGDAYNLYGQTGSEIVYKKEDVLETGKVLLEEGDMNTFDIGLSLGKDWPRDYLHPVAGTPGSDLGAGLFIMPSQDKSAQEPSFTKKTYTYKTVDDHEILADVYLPKKNEVRPVIIYMHGWYMADSRHSFEERGKALLDKLIEANYAVVPIDFRLAPETKLEQMVEDVKDACIWVREKGPELFNIDPHKVAVMGGSSGGTMALTAGYILKNRPQVVIAISGPGDLSWAGKSDGDKSVLEKKEKPYDIVGDKVVTIATHSDRYKLWPYLTEKGLYLWELLGFEWELEPDRFNALLPIKNFTSNYPPTLVVRSQGEGYADIKKHLDAKNIENEQFVVPDVHSIKIIGKYPEAGEKIVFFLDKHLK